MTEIKDDTTTAASTTSSTTSTPSTAVLNGATSTSNATTTTRSGFVQGAELDLVFTLDCTGSMSSYIHSATESIQNIVTKLVQSEKANLRFGLVCYRDHPPQDNSYITKVYPFTSSTKSMQESLADQAASGGGDGPEAVTTALHEALKMDWRPNATRIVVSIADAPPHGLGEQGDGFPNGEPKVGNGPELDPLRIVREMRDKGITIFSVACEPALSGYKFAVDFFNGIARITGGSLLPLTSASLLPDVIIGGAKEQLDMDKLVEEAAKEAEKIRAEGGATTDEEVATKVWLNMKSKGVKTRQMHVTPIYSAAVSADMEYNAMQFEKAGSLKEAISSAKPVSNRLDGMHSSASSGGDMSSKPRTTMAAPAVKSPGVFGSLMGSRSAMLSAPMPPIPGMVPPPVPAMAACTPSAMDQSAPVAQKVDVNEEEISMEQVTRLMKQSNRYSSKKK